MRPAEHDAVKVFTDRVGVPLVLRALHEAVTSGAKKPWPYAQTILKECIAKGITTVDGYEQSHAEHGRSARGQERTIAPEDDLILRAAIRPPVFKARSPSE